MKQVMKLTGLLTALLVLYSCLGTMGTAEASSAAVPLGVVDYVYLIEHHPDAAKANESLRVEREQAKKGYEAKASGLGEKERQELDRQLSLQVEQKRQALLKPIVESINTAMKAVAEAKGMMVVLHKNTVALGGTDITEEVLKKLAAK